MIRIGRSFTGGNLHCRRWNKRSSIGHTTPKHSNRFDQRASPGKRQYSNSSANSTKAAELTTDEKAAEITKDSWPTLRKYAPIIIPTLLTAVVTIDIINNPYHRMLLESVFPSYVELVRKNYGFVDENEAERQRVKWLLKEQTKPVNVRLRGRSGDMLVITDSSTTVSQMLSQLVRMAAATTDGADKQQQQSAQYQQSIVEQFATLKQVEFIDEASSTADQHVAQLQQHGQHSTNETQSAVIDYFTSSTWQQQPTASAELKSRSLRDYQRQSLLKSPALPVVDERVLLLRFENHALDVFDGLRQYQQSAATAAGGGARIPIRLAPASQYQQAHGSSSGNGSWISSSSAAAAEESLLRRKLQQQQTEMQKLQAQHRISELEAAILVLQRERISGAREIDDIDAEIRHQQQQIVSLQRQHLNYFYYF